MKVLGQKRSWWGGALPVLVAAFFPVFAYGLDRSNGTYRLRDDVNEGGVFFQQNGNYKLHGSVGAIETTLSLNGNYHLAPGPQLSFYFPQTITDLTLSTDTPNSLLMKWTAPAAGPEYTENVSFYEIRYSKDELNESNFETGIMGPIVDAQPVGFKHTDVPLPNLTYDTVYNAGIVSLDNDSPKNRSYVGTAIPVRTLANPPDTPFLSSDRHEKTITVQFLPNNPNSGHSLTFEGCISETNHYPPLPEDQAQCIQTYAVTNNDMQSLTFGAGLHFKRKSDYYVFLRALNGSGVPTKWKGPYGSIQIDPGVPTLQPYANLTASGFTVNWSANINGGGYQSLVDTSDAFNTSNLHLDPVSGYGNILSSNFNNLLGNTTYYYKVSGKDKHGDLVGDTNIEHLVTLVQKPVAVSVTDVFQTSATVHWLDSDSNDNELGAHGFVVELATVPFASNPTHIILSDKINYTGSREMEFKFIGSLTPNAPYFARITGVNRNLKPSTGGDVYTTGVDPLFKTKPAVPVLVPATQTDPTYELAFTLNPRGNDPLTVFAASLYPSLDCSGESLSLAPSISGQTFIFKNQSESNRVILANKQYSACVTAKGLQTGTDVQSVPVTQFTQPIAPQHPQVVATPNELAVSWLNYEGLARNDDATAYRLDWKINGEEALLGSKTGDPELVADHLAPNTTYQLTLSALTKSITWSDVPVTWKGVTLAKNPDPVSFTLYTDSGTVTWGDNGNPDGTIYIAKMSTHEDLSDSIVPTVMGIHSATFTLISDTFYYVGVMAKNHMGMLTDWVKQGPFGTDPAQPVEVVVDVGGEPTKTLSVHWGTNGNPGDTTYRVLVATGTDFEHQEVHRSDLITGSSWVTQPVLTPNTLYYVRVDAVGKNTHKVSSPIVQKRTEAKSLGAPTVSWGSDAMHQLQLEWGANGNPDGTVYSAQISTSTHFEVEITTTVSELKTVGVDQSSHLFGELVPNRLYYLRVGVKVGAMDPPYGGWVSKFTQPNVPVNLTVKSVPINEQESRVQFQWLPGENEPLGTGYKLELARDHSFSDLVGEYALAANVTSWKNSLLLEANRQYFAQVRAVANAGESFNSSWSSPVSTYTAVLAPQEVGVDKSSSTLKVVWSDEKAGVRNAVTTIYKLAWKIDGPNPWLGPLTQTGQTSPLALTATALLPNTTYDLMLTAVQASGSGWGDAWWTENRVTLATVPVAGAYMTYTSSGTVAWGPNGNPAGTVFEVKMASNVGFQNSFGPSEQVDFFAKFNALTPNTTYWVQARAINHANEPTVNWAKWDPKPTDAVMPLVQEGDFTLFTDSCTVKWNSNGNPAGTKYRVMVRDNGIFSPLLADPVIIQNAENQDFSVDITGLSSNKLHSMRVDAVGHNGKVVSSIVLDNKTAPAPIVSLNLAPTGDTTRHLKLIWNVHGNSPETRYVAEISTDPLFGVGVYSNPTLPGVSESEFDGLISNQKYYAHVKPDVAGTSFSTSVTTTTWPSLPGNVAGGTVDPTFNAHRISFSWGHGNNAPESTRYEISVSSKVGNQEYLVKTLTTGFGENHAEFTELEGILWANQKYVGVLRALALDGVPAHNSLPKDSFTFTAPLPPQSLSVVTQTTGTITISWIAPSVTTAGKVIQNSPGTNFQVDWGQGVATEHNLVSGTGSDFNFKLGQTSGLTPNATYFIDVLSVPGAESSFSGGRTRLLPAPATDPMAPMLEDAGISVYQTSMTVVWNSNGNDPGSKYQLELYDYKNTNTLIYQTTFPQFTTPGDLFPAAQYRVGVKVIGRNTKVVNGNNEIIKVTKTVSPLIDSVAKPDGEGGKQKFELFWSSGGNSDQVRYDVSLDGTGWNTNAHSPREFIGLNSNARYTLWIRAHNGSTPGFSFASTTSWTRAEAPLAATVISPLVGNSLGIGFPETVNPPETEYAIRIVTTTSEVPVLTTSYAKLVDDAIPGEALFQSEEPIWLTTTNWLNNGKLIFTNLPEEIGYRIVLISRNHSNQEEVSGTGLDITQSAGIPLVTLETAQGLIVTNLMSLDQPIFFNSATVPFRAVHSSHYNVLWGTNITEIKGTNLASTYGWNGFNDGNLNCVALNETYSLNNTALRGFCAGEGVYYLNVAGTAILKSGLDTSNVVSTSPFRIYIDTTPPVPSELNLSFKANPFAPLLQDTLYGNPTPYFVWGSTDSLGKAESRSPLLGWSVSVSTDSNVRPERSTDPSKGYIPFQSKPGISVDLHSVTFSSATVYYKVRGYDLAGNWTPDNLIPEFRYKYTPDQVLPELAGIQLDGKLFPTIDKTVRYAAVSPHSEFVHLTFSEPMLVPDKSFQLTLLRGPDGKTENRSIFLNSIPANQATAADGKQILPFTSSETIEPGSLYRFTTSTSPIPTDRANNPLSAGVDVLFYTAMNPAIPAVFSSEVDDVSVKVNAFALGNEPAGVAINDRPDKVSVAGSPSLSRLLGDANDSLGRQTGGAFKKILLAKELTVFNTNGDMRTQAYEGGVELVFDYSKPIEKQTQAGGRPLKAQDLVIYELDEKTGVWSKMPNAQLDESRHVVSVPLRHNGTYGLGSTPNFDLTSAHPYPVPYRATRDVHGISFTGLSSYGTIKIYTLDGRLVKTIRFDGESSVAWDPVQSDSGETVGSDVYLYMIENDQQRIVGKLMVIR